MMGGKSITVIPIMWALVVIILAMTGLRLYLRRGIMDQVGADDHVYVLSSALLLFSVVFFQVAAVYGFGQSVTSLSQDDVARAIKFEMVGQTIAIVNMTVAKWALGLFLLRIVVKKWHRLLTWAVMISLMVVTLVTVVTFWIQCLPPSSMWDSRIKGTCILNITPISILLGVWCIFADISFAVLPWIFVWPLNMSKQEKIVIAGSMSLGIIAAICGIVRTVELEGFNSNNYTEDTVGLVIWSSVETAITMICNGIPVLRPLWTQWFTCLGGPSKDNYRRHSRGRDGPVFTMHTFGGGTMTGAQKDRGFPDAPAKLGIRGPTTKTRVTSKRSASDEDILQPEGSSNDVGIHECTGICVKDDVDVEFGKLSRVVTRDEV